MQRFRLSLILVIISATISRADDHAIADPQPPAEPTMDELMSAGGHLLGMTPEQFKVLLESKEKLKQEYAKSSISPQGLVKLQAIMRKAITNIDATVGPIANEGNNLPISFIDLYFPKQHRIDPSWRSDLLKLGFMGLKVENLSDQWTLSDAAYWINSHPEIVVPVLQERAKVFPPTAADYILYGMVTDAFDHNGAPYSTTFGGPPDVPLSRAAGILQLGQAKNPIYRLLAAEAADHVEPDKNKRVNFYSVYLNETDPVIQNVAIKGVAQTQTSAMVSVLQSFQTAAQQNGNTEGAQTAQEAIRRFSK